MNVQRLYLVFEAEAANLAHCGQRRARKGVECISRHFFAGGRGREQGMPRMTERFEPGAILYIYTDPGATLLQGKTATTTVVSTFKEIRQRPLSRANPELHSAGRSRALASNFPRARLIRKIHTSANLLNRPRAGSTALLHCTAEEKTKRANGPGRIRL